MTITNTYYIFPKKEQIEAALSYLKAIDATQETVNQAVAAHFSSARVENESFDLKLKCCLARSGILHLAQPQHLSLIKPVLLRLSKKHTFTEPTKFPLSVQPSKANNPPTDYPRSHKKYNRDRAFAIQRRAHENISNQ